MMKRFIIVILISLILVGCNKSRNSNPNKGIKEAEIKKIWGVKKITMNNPGRCAGLYNNMVYFINKTKTNFILKFYSLGGKLKRKIKFDISKGPGGIVSTFSLKIKDDKIYIYDSTLARISIFNMNGEFIDLIKVNKNIGIYPNMDINDGVVYLTGHFRNKLVKFDLTKGKILKKIEYENSMTKNDFFDKNVLTGALTYDKNDDLIYLGYYNKPYRIVIYDTNLKKKGRITRGLDEKLKKVKWMKLGRGTALIGEFAIHSLFIDKKYIYAPYGYGFTYTKKRIRSLGDVENTIHIFDKKTGKYIYDVWNKKLNNSGFGYTILGANKKHIVLFSIFDKNVVDGLKTKKEKVGKRAWIFVLENPLYNN